MSLQHNLGLAKRVFDHVKKVVTIGAGNKPNSTLAQKMCVRQARTDAAANNRAFCSSYRGACWGGTPWPQIIRSAAKAAIKNGCGNCGEQTAVGFMFLHDQMVRPLDFMALRESDPQFHQFLVIGRANGSSARDYDSWGSEAVVCDVWDGKVYPAADMGAKMHGSNVTMAPKSLWRVDGWAAAGTCPIDG